MKYYPSKKESDLFYYYLANGERRWRIRYRYSEHGKQHEKSKSGFASEKEALRTLLELKAAQLNGIHRQLEPGSMTVDQWFDTWYQSNAHNWKVSTRNNRESAIRLYIKPSIGHIKLQKLDKATYQRLFIKPLYSTLKDGTIEQLHSIFKIGVNAAVEEDVLMKNRFKKVKIQNPETLEEDTLKYYTPEELDLFLSAAKEHAPFTPYLLFKCLAFSGARRGEMLGLTWRHIDFDNCTFRIVQTRDDKGVRSPKTKNSYRTISMDREVIEELKVYRTWCKRTMLEFGMRWTEESFVFISGYTGNPYSTTAIQSMMKTVQKLSGVPVLPPHALRHTHATLLMLNPEINVKAIAERLGNTVDMIYKVYGHILQKSTYETMLAFSDVMKQQKAAEKHAEKDA